MVSPVTWSVTTFAAVAHTIAYCGACQPHRVRPFRVGSTTFSVRYNAVVSAPPPVHGYQMERVNQQAAGQGNLEDWQAECSSKHRANVDHKCSSVYAANCPARHRSRVLLRG